MTTTSDHSARNTAQVLEIPLDTITPSPYQRRTEFRAIEELAESIRVHGVMQPVTVRALPFRKPDACSVPEPEPGKNCLWTSCAFNSLCAKKAAVPGVCQMLQEYELIAGERRLRGARAAGLLTIPALVRDVDDRTAAELVALENLQREDLNAIEVAESFRVLTENGLTQAQIGERLGLAQPTIANALRLLELPAVVQARIRAGELSASHGRALLRWAEYPTLLDAIAAHVLGENMPVKELEKLDLTDYRLTGPLHKSGAVYQLSSWVDAGGRGNLRMDWGPICKDCPQYVAPKASYSNPLCLKPECAKGHVKQQRGLQKAEEDARLEAVRAKHPEVESFEQVTGKLKYNEWNWMDENPVCLKDHPDCPHLKTVDRGGAGVSQICLDAKCWTSYRDKQRQQDERQRREKADAIRAQITPLFHRDSFDPEALLRVIALSIYEIVRNETNSTQEAAWWRVIGFDEATEEQWENVFPARLEAICAAYRQDADRVYLHLARALSESRLHEMVEQPYRSQSMLTWMLGELKPVRKETAVPAEGLPGCENCGAGEDCLLDDGDEPEGMICANWRPETRMCRVCGCSEEDACETDGPCWWVWDDLCSGCAVVCTACNGLGPKDGCTTCDGIGYVTKAEAEECHFCPVPCCDLEDLQQCPTRQAWQARLAALSPVATEDVTGVEETLAADAPAEGVQEGGFLEEEAEERLVELEPVVVEPAAEEPAPFEEDDHVARELMTCRHCRHFEELQKKSKVYTPGWGLCTCAPAQMGTAPLPGDSSGCGYFSYRGTERRDSELV